MRGLAFVGGILVAVFFGCIAGVFGIAGAMTVTESPVLAFLLATLAPLVLIAVLWALVRRRAPAFAKGLIVGGCLVLLLCGLCNYTILGGFSAAP